MHHDEANQALKFGLLLEARRVPLRPGRPSRPEPLLSDAPLRPARLGTVAGGADRNHPPAGDGRVRPGDHFTSAALYPDDGAGRRGLGLPRAGRFSRDGLFQPVLHPRDDPGLFPGRAGGGGLAVHAPAGLGLGGGRRPLRGHDVRNQRDVGHRLRRRRSGLRPGAAWPERTGREESLESRRRQPGRRHRAHA